MHSMDEMNENDSSMKRMKINEMKCNEMKGK